MKISTKKLFFVFYPFWKKYSSQHFYRNILLVLNPSWICIKPFCWLILLMFANAINAQSIDVSIDPTVEYQTIDGFGASDAWRVQFVGKNWPENKKNRIAELLFSKEMDGNGNPKGIGLSIWRFYIGAGTAEQGDASGIKNEWRRAESFIDENGNYDWSKQQGQQWFLQKAKDYGVGQFLAFSIAAPTFWSVNNKGWNSRTDGNLNLKDKYYDDYANFLVEILDHFEKKGLAFDYLSPINEPQWDWEKATQEGTPATNKNIADLVGLLNKGISEKGLETEIVVPEAADLRFLYSEHGRPKRGNQIADFFGNPQQETYIEDYGHLKNTISGHSYFTTWPVDSLISIRQNLHQALKKHGLDFWQTEFCILLKNDDIVGGHKRDLGMATALYVARIIHADLTLTHAKSWQWWTAISNADFKDGLIYIDTGNPENMYDRELLKTNGEFHDSKLLWALGNYSRFIRPGMIRVQAKLDTKLSLRQQYENVMVSAYKNPATNAMVLVAINYSNETKSLKFESEQIAINNIFETSAGKDLEMIEWNGNQVELKPRSITTIRGKFTHL